MNAQITVDGITYDVAFEGNTIRVNGHAFARASLEPVAIVGPAEALLAGRVQPFRLDAFERKGAGAAAGASAVTRIKPPMTGKLESIRVAVGDAVTKGDILFVLEAMKMQNDVKAPGPGVVTAIHAKTGATVDTQHVIVELGPA